MSPEDDADVPRSEVTPPPRTQTAAQRLRTVFGLGSETSGAVLVAVCGAGVQWLLAAPALASLDPPLLAPAAALVFWAPPVLAIVWWRRTAARLGATTAGPLAVLGLWLALSVVVFAYFAFGF